MTHWHSKFKIYVNYFCEIHHSGAQKSFYSAVTHFCKQIRTLQPNFASSEQRESPPRTCTKITEQDNVIDVMMLTHPSWCSAAQGNQHNYTRAHTHTHRVTKALHRWADWRPRPDLRHDTWGSHALMQGFWSRFSFHLRCTTTQNKKRQRLPATSEKSIGRILCSSQKVETRCCCWPLITWSFPLLLEGIS